MRGNPAVVALIIGRNHLFLEEPIQQTGIGRV